MSDIGDHQPPHLRSQSAESGGNPGQQFDWNHPATWPMMRAVVIVVSIGAVVIAGGYSLLTVISQSMTVVQRVTTAFAIATAVGALVALVVNLRKQDVSETTEQRLAAGELREIAAAFTDRFRNAAEQLGRPSALERIAGVYAMAALADEYPDRVQQCIDVLCGYLRLPYDPRRDELLELTSTYMRAERTVIETPATPTFDGIVRTTITDVIRAHTVSAGGFDRGRWSDLDFDLTGAHLFAANLAGAQFHGRLDFDGARFHGSTTFSQAHYYTVPSFRGAHFYAAVEFTQAHFHSFAHFQGAHFHGLAGFSGAKFHEYAALHEVRFDALAYFIGTRFNRTVVFEQAYFRGPSFFLEAHFDEDVLFRRAHFRGDIMFGGALFHRDARFDRAEAQANVSFDDCPQIPGSRVDLDGLILIGDAEINGDEQPFNGWDLRNSPSTSTGPPDAIE